MARTREEKLAYWRAYNAKRWADPAFRAQRAEYGKLRRILHRDHVLALEAARRKERRAHISARQKTLRQRDTSAARARDKARYQRDWDARRAAAKKWYERNPGKQLAYGKAWKKANPERHAFLNRMTQHRRRARLRAADAGVIDQTTWRKVVADFDGLCAYCRRRPGITVDHVIPLVRGGKHELSNLVPACKRCNSSKGIKEVQAWLASAAFARLCK